MTKTKMAEKKFSVGDWVWFEIPGAKIFGTIEKFRRKTALVFRKFSSGYSRRKAFEKLRMWDVKVTDLVPVSEDELKGIQSILDVQPRQYVKKDKKKK
jgi:hypothetical protein